MEIPSLLVADMGSRCSGGVQPSNRRGRQFVAGPLVAGVYTRERGLVRRRGTDGQRRAVVQFKYDGEVFTSNFGLRQNLGI